VKRSAPYLSDQALDRELTAVVAKEDTATAAVLDHIAEFDARKLYLPAGYPSMFAYCVDRLRRSDEAAYKRIRAARAARRFPVIFDAIAEGRLHLTGVVLLAPYLTENTATELLAAASHKTTKQIEQLVAERFPRPDLAALVQAIRPSAPAVSPGTELAPSPQGDASQRGQLALRPVEARPQASDRPSLKPLAPQRFAVQFTMGQAAHDKLRHVQELLGHQVPSGDLAQVFELALDALIPELERRKFAATAKPRLSHRRSETNGRHIPARVRRTVWVRDQGQCTFVSESGHRCEARKPLEFDHVQEVARGGEATVAGIRLRCRAHNQYQAECTFGAEFMGHKRIAAAETRAVAKECAVAGVRTSAAAAERPSAEPASSGG